MNLVQLCHLARKAFLIGWATITTLAAMISIPDLLALGGLKASVVLLVTGFLYFLATTALTVMIFGFTEDFISSANKESNQ